MSGAALELDQQLETLGVHPNHLYVCGANMTPAGMALGFKVLGREIKLVNITPIQWSMPRNIDIAENCQCHGRSAGTGC